MIMKYTIDKSIRQSITFTDNVKNFLAPVGDKFTKFDKAKKGTFMKLLTTTTYDGASGVREHIMKLTHSFNKLRQIKVELANSFLVWQVLESLPSQFDALKTTYNAQRDKWSLSEMTAIVTQEEEVIKKGKSHAVFMMTNDSGHFKRKPYKGDNSGNETHKVKKFRKFSQQIGVGVSLEPKIEEFKGKCNFCHVYGHKKTNCKKYTAWLEKKGITKHQKAE